MKYLNPIVFVNRLISLIKELLLFRKYLKIVSELDKNNELFKLGLRRTQLGRIYYVKNLQPEVLLNTDDLQGFELMQVKESLAEYNDPITKLGLIDFVKTGFQRIKTQDVYAYLIWMEFDFKQTSLERILYVIVYPLLTILLIVWLLIPFLGTVDWPSIWLLLNGK